MRRMTGVSMGMLCENTLDDEGTKKRRFRVNDYRVSGYFKR